MINSILVGDVLSRIAEIPDESVHCCITSPPYWGLRDYGVPGQLGLEPTPEEYVARMVEVFREGRRVLRSDGTLWLNMGDSYAGSGRGNNPNGKQGTNRGTRTDTLPRHEFLSPGRHGLHHERVKAGAIGADWTPPPPGLKCKDLVGIPWRLAFALQADGWWLRSDIIWSKPNPMPESVTDRPTKAHEYVFLLAKSERYYFDAAAVRSPYSESTIQRVNQPTFDSQNGGPKDPKEGNRSHRKALKNLADKQRGHGRRHNGFNDRWDHMEREEQLQNGANIRTVWSIATQPFPEAHFATFPEKLVEPCILAGCPEGGTVLDPFMGSGTVALVALKARRNFIGIELNPKYAAMAMARIAPELSQGRLA